MSELVRTDLVERMRKFYLIYSNSATPLRNSKKSEHSIIL